jgi:hypothetical protein
MSEDSPIRICPKCAGADWLQIQDILKTTFRCKACGFESSSTLDINHAIKKTASLTGAALLGSVVFTVLVLILLSVVFK